MISCCMHARPLTADRCTSAPLTAAGVGLLMVNYVAAIALAFMYPGQFNQALMAGVHALLAAVLTFRAFKLHAAGYTKDAILSFYRWIWNLFYSEYAIFAFL